MVWKAASAEDGAIYYYDPATGAVSWHKPLDMPVPPAPPSLFSQYEQQFEQQQQPARVVAPAIEMMPPQQSAAADFQSPESPQPPPTHGDERTGSIKAKIDNALSHGPCCLKQCGNGLLRCVDGADGPCALPIPGCATLRMLTSSLVYGISFVPFVFALLQQANAERTAVDPFSATSNDISRRSWLAGFVFLGAVSLYALIAFTALTESYWYAAGSPPLMLLMGSVVAATWIQQGLTLRYISLRPELSHLEKNRSAKYPLCGHVYSTMDRSNYINYIYLSGIVAEFFLFASVCFHPKIPWRGNGATEGDEPLVDWLQSVLPQALAGSVPGLLVGANLAVLVILLGIVAL